MEERSHKSVLETAEGRFEKRLAQLEAKIEKRFAELETKFEKRFAELETKMADMRADLIKWMFLFWAGQIGVQASLFVAFFRR